MFMVLLSAFQVMLSRSTGQTDIAVGTDIANRNRTEVEPLIGFFINHVVLRADLFRNPTFRELLGEVRMATIEAYANQDLPFERIVEALQPGRDPSRNPLFQVLFVLQNAPRTAVEIEGIVLRLKEVENRSAKFDIALFLEETEQGLFGVWNYNTDLFKETTINRLTMQLEKLLRNIVANPDQRVSTYDMLSESEKLQQTARKQRRKQARLKMLLDASPEAVSLPRESLVRILAPEQSLPVAIQPEVNDLDLIDWAGSERAFIEASLLKSGAILFRGFGIDSLTRFEQFAQAACPRLFGDYGDLPREEMGGKIYGSTPYPAEKAILFHNESSHTHQWPMKIFFHCRKAAEQGGETPIVDCRRVYQRLDPEIRERFEKKRLLYVRNFTDGLDVSWQDFFRTSDRAAVEEYCMRNSIQFEWKANNGLRTRQQGIAVAKHPKTGERIFFNQIQLHHIGFLSPEVRSSLLSLFEEEDLPRHVYHGDGSPIEEEVIQQIRKVYEECAVEFRWQEGDVMMLDNMLVAHARNPYVGRRKIVVAMGEMINSKELEQEGI
jgi:alpha-ketoglutarate-dependent taurine dioxygenase